MAAPAHASHAVARSRAVAPGRAATVAAHTPAKAPSHTTKPASHAAPGRHPATQVATPPASGKAARGSHAKQPATRRESLSESRRARRIERDAPDPPLAVRIRGRRAAAEAPASPAPLSAKIVRAAPAAPTLTVADEAPPPALPEVHVRHNRKLHLAPSPAADPAAQADEAPRKAGDSTGKHAALPLTASPAATEAAAVRRAEPLPSAARAGIAATSAADDADQPNAAIATTLTEPLRPAASTPASAAAGRLPAPSRVAPGQHAPLPAGTSPVVVARVPSVEDEVLTPDIGLPALLDHRGRLIVPPAMKGTHEILVHQNVMADADGLDRIQDDADLDRMRAAHLLVALPVSAAIVVDDRLPANRRFARPWTVLFLTDLARAHYTRFHMALQVNSAVRTVEFQHRLIRTNGNAAPAEGATASPHLTGQAIDLAKHGLSMAEIAWLRGYLLPLVQEGKVDVEEEFQQSCFHISVYKRYRPLPTAPESPQRHGVAKSLATALE